ncbi:unnamed protein product [Tuber aestivum]|uniref:Dienelactone hydrolase domain-containing protein n=1 Tax=Tuber aestivum TaxID=59557 RepID=A0A292PYS7_9PEZI|nr:unnamed protein product [Tuber aestivum]
MASNAPGECCIKGVLHEGTPKGEVVQITEVETYITRPASGSSEKVILLLTDVMGLCTNPKLIADDFAANGYTVLVPDIFAGDNVPLPADRKPGFQLPEWLKNHQPHHVVPIIQKVMDHIRSDLKPRKIGAVGYCFGAKYVTQLLSGQIDAGYNAHPSFVTLDELCAIKAPLAISAAGIAPPPPLQQPSLEQRQKVNTESIETDSIFTPELRHATEAKLAEIKATYQITLFSGVEHGFAVRCNLANEKQRWAKEEAFWQAIRMQRMGLKVSASEIE